MDGLAAAVAGAAGWSADTLAARYFETEAGGVERLVQPDAAFAMVTLPFFLDHRSELGLTPIAQAVPRGQSACEPWSLVAGTGKVKVAADLEGWELVSLAGHSPRFVRGAALGGWGPLPGSTEITFSGAILSALRKAARGEHIALLLDAPQTAALDRLPFAASLEVVYSSRPLPVSVVCSVAGRAGAQDSSAFKAALLKLADRPAAAEALTGVRIERFVDVERAALAEAVEGFEGSRP